MRLTKWLALLLTICLLIGMTPVALSEGIEIDIEDGNTVETDSDIAELDPELNLDLSEDVLALELPELEQEEIPANPNAAAEENDGELLDNAKNYTALSNDTAFTLNGVTVRASDEGTKGSGNCWKWAQAIYKKVWGCNFDSTFEGTASKGHNLVRNLTDDERRLTPENLKHMVSSAKPGATLRVQSCPSSCSGFNTDGCSKHNLHSLIIAEIRDDGLGGLLRLLVPLGVRQVHQVAQCARADLRRIDRRLWRFEIQRDLPRRLLRFQGHWRFYDP